MLTDIKIRSLKAGTKARKVFDEKGLYVQVQPKKMAPYAKVLGSRIRIAVRVLIEAAAQLISMVPPLR